MLTEQRFEAILELLEEKNSVTVKELTELLDASESTIRRDLTVLNKAGKLVKVFGGAVALDTRYNTTDPEIEERLTLHNEEKRLVAEYAAGMIKPDDIVFLDAGTTTGCMIEYLENNGAKFVTNGITHAKELSHAGFRVVLIGGELKRSTEATVGAEAMSQLAKFNFTLGFFGTNGVSKKAGFTTPDMNEATVKNVAMSRCRKKIVLCDYSKFGQISSVTFGNISDAVIVTDQVPDEYENFGNIIGLNKISK